MSTTVIAYVPAIHKGYLDFFERYRGADFFLIGDAWIDVLVQEESYYARDVRRVPEKEMLTLLRSLDIFETVDVLKQDPDIPQDVSIVMPDEDISQKVADVLFKDRKVQFEQNFLRWNKRITEREYQVFPEEEVSEEDIDKKLMRHAFSVGNKSSDWWRQIGALLVKDGEVLVAGHNTHLPHDQIVSTMGDPRSNYDAGVHIELTSAIHAEARVIAEAAKRGISTEDTSLYVTTFPCPVCAKSILCAGVKEVYFSEGYSLLDSEQLLKEAGVRIVRVHKTPR